MRCRPSARLRLSVAAVVFVALVIGLVLVGLTVSKALLLGFDLGAMVFLGGMLRLFNKASTQTMRHQARVQDAGRWAILWSAMGVTAVVMLALGTELHAATAAACLAIAIAAVSIVLSWLFINVMFALHYAHGYYGDYGRAPWPGVSRARKNRTTGTSPISPS